MIITCPNCNKQFKIDSSLIPDEGRDLQCGSCNNVWFYKVEGGGHDWPGAWGNQDINASEEIWKFFKKHIN